MRSTVRMRAAAMSSVSLSQFPSVRPSSLLALSVALGALAGCAGPQTAQQYAVRRESNGVDPRYGVRASPRVIADGEPVPQGGGRYQVGKPYSIAGKTYYPSERPYAAVGSASWYGSDFHGRLTANGEVFDRNSFSAAHPTMPLPSYARVTNMQNAHSMVVRVNDRGPYHGGRVMDVSQRVAEALDFKDKGTAKVKIEWLGRAELAGSDKAKLLASLRTDGSPAELPGYASPVMIAAHDAPVRTASAQTTRSDIDDDLDEPASSVVRRSVAHSEETAKHGKDVAEDAAPSAKEAASKAANAPLPPTRPLDLGVAPNKTAKMAAARRV